MSQQKSWLRRRVESALRNGFLRAYETVKVDPEGSVKGGNQTHQAMKRGGLGAGIGAIIGGIAGGGGGAAIGAIIGGAGGAGSVAVQGRDDLKLNRGSMITVQSSSRTPASKTLSKK